jgi:hypothetical protein
MSFPLKRTFSWLAVIVGLAGVAVSYCGIWVLLAYFAAGLVWYANLFLFVSGPIAGVGAIVAWRTPRQFVAASVGGVAFVGWLILWTLMLTVLGFRF